MVEFSLCITMSMRYSQSFAVYLGKTYQKYPYLKSETEREVYLEQTANDTTSISCSILTASAGSKRRSTATCWCLFNSSVKN